MKKEVKSVFKLTGTEVEIALYDYYVRKLREDNINVFFCEKDIDISFNDFLEVSLTINQEEEI